MKPRHISREVVLYRIGYPYVADSFWATDRDYPTYIYPDSTAPLWQARLAATGALLDIQHAEAV